jgi:hypothetical protein
MTRRALFCLALLLGVRGLRAQSYGGYFDSADCGTLQGWAWDATQPNTPINVSIYDTYTSTTIATVS